MLPLASHSSGQTVLTEPEKTVLHLTHISCQKLQLKYQVNQNWSRQDQNGVWTGIHPNVWKTQ